MLRSSISLTLAVLIASAATPALAKKSWKFELINKSAAHVTTFKTREGGQWSENWLEENVAPGETFDMDFGTDEGNCKVRTRIEFSDNTYVDANIDYCEADVITVRNSGITWE